MLQSDMYYEEINQTGQLELEVPGNSGIGKLNESEKQIGYK